MTRPTPDAERTVPALQPVRLPEQRAVPAPRPRPDRAPDGNRSGNRLIGVDAARGVALLGIVAVHALVETTDDGVPTPSYLIFGGRSAALFALLAGVSFAFLTARARVRPGPDLAAAAASLATRAGMLMLVGLALSWTDPTIAALILPYYAVAFLLAIPLVAVPTRVLAPLAVLLCAGVPVLSHLVRPALPDPSLANPSLVEIVTDPGGVLSELAVTGAYPAVLWVSYMAVGIVVGRLRLSSPRTALALLGGGTAVAVVATVTSMWLLGPGGGYAAIAAASPPALPASAPTIADAVAGYPDGVTPTTTWWWLATVAPHSGTPLDVLQTAGSALAVLGAALLLAGATHRVVAPVAGVLVRPLAAAGSMTLTFYVASILFMNSPLDVFDPVEGYLWQIGVALAAGTAWRRAVGRGPLETLVSAPAHAVRDRVRARTRDRVAPAGAPRSPIAAGRDRR
ncbi:MULTISPECIES: heparan-alpha-glucosaminide N-acetyltransferase domain-containing protein [unclassified Pseudonocardia]|uniref:heparan-alpha-glucosaminide N-acetyltransferase domain-containing protein n=1 Tax=unclassified Pseudonocardia TaxID=2619320 RepID=UPI000760FD6D|nr:MULTISPECIES: heparan-alpha-glucosaminide N-acetyltransferase domain-containing protein [unclassified Pseudonocardia]